MLFLPLALMILPVSCLRKRSNIHMGFFLIEVKGRFADIGDTFGRFDLFLAEVTKATQQSSVPRSGAALKQI